MTETPETDPPTVDTPRRPSFITPKMIEKNPALAAAEIFSGDTLFEEVMEEIKKERGRQKRRERTGATK